MPISIGYADFISLFQIKNPADWVSWLVVRKDGVYVRAQPDDASLEPAERAVLTEHPTGNLSVPILRFPFDIDELQPFTEQFGVRGYIDAFDMLRFFQKAASIGPNGSTTKLDPRERTTLLCIIGALAKKAGIDLSQPHRVSAEVAKLLPGDVKLSARTIGDHLKDVRDAIDSRRN